MESYSSLKNGLGGLVFFARFSSSNKLLTNKQSFVLAIFWRILFYLFACFLLFALIETLLHKSLGDIGKEFFPFLWHFFAGDWGYSTLYHTNVSSFVWEYFLASSLLGLCSLFSAFIMGISIALYTMFLPRVSKILQIVFLGTPITIWAIIINFFFTGGLTAPNNLGASYSKTNFFLPWIVVTFYHSCAILQMSQFFFLEEAKKPYYRLLCRLSTKSQKVFPRYLIKPHMSSILHNLSLKICILLGGSVGIENFFHIQGLGFLLRKSILQKDTALLITASFMILTFITLVYLLLGLLRDFLIRQQEEIV